MRYKKIKMLRENFGEFKKCIWCRDSGSSSHIFLECDTMKSRLLEWGVVRKLHIVEKEWSSDHVDSGDPLWKEKEVLMSIIKWSIWKQYLSQRYGNKLIPFASIANSVCIEQCLYLGKCKEIKCLMYIKQWWLA